MKKSLCFAIIMGIFVFSEYVFDKNDSRKSLSDNNIYSPISTGNYFGMRALAGEKRPAYLSPGAIAVNEKQNIAYTALTTDKSIAISYISGNKTVDKIKLKQNPNDLIISPDASTLYVSCGAEDGTVAVIRLSDKKVKATIKVGHTPQSLALSGDGNTLYVANRFNDNISVIDLSKNKEIAQIPVVREPRAIVLTPDKQTLAVANFLPSQAANGSVVAATISLIDVKTNKVRSNITLDNGAQSLAGLACSSDGKYLYAVHLLSQYNALITQIERGWVNTSALSIIDLKSDSIYAAVLLDDVDNGAANPAGICVDNQKLFIAVAGTHELITVDLAAMHKKLETFFAGKSKELHVNNKSDLLSSMSFISPFKKRIALQGRSPRAVACINGAPLVSSKFSAFLEKPESSGTVIISLGNEPEADAIRRGELAFYDATICYQKWQSCASCHPDGRADGLNWDQMNDGLGNPKNTKSLLFSHVTPPCMITGIRETAELAVRKGIVHTLQSAQPESIASDMDEYLKNMRPLVSPWLQEYLKKDAQQKGKAIFDRAKCSDCHNGEYLTDLQKYNVATGTDESKDLAFDTPSLRELWRTAPYLYNGKAITIKEVLTTFNKNDKHGITQNLTDEEIEALVLYLKTL